MKMSRFKTSITAKLFILMTSLVLITVVGMTIQATAKFKKFLLQNIQDGSLSQTERAAVDTAATIDTFVSKVSVALPKIDLEQGAKGQSVELNALLRNDPEIISASIFYNSGSVSKQIIAAKSPFPQSGSSDRRYEGKSPDIIKNRTFAAAAIVANQHLSDPSRRQVQVRNIAPETELPIMAISIRFEIDGTQSNSVTVVIACWQTRLLVALPKARITNSYIVDSRGDIFASSDTRDTLRRVSMAKSPLVNAALRRLSPSGFLDEYRDNQDRSKLGAFAQVANYPDLFVMLEKDAEATFMVISRSYYSALVWASLFILIAIMASFIGAGSSTRTIKELLQVTREIARGNLSARVHPTSRDEIAELGVSVNHMAGKIKELLSTQIEKAKFEKELETARMVQSTFFPKKDIDQDYLKVTGFYQPATQCGGDLWGHFKVDSSKQIVFIADAMGHGAPAALVTAIGYAVCQAMATILRDEPTLTASPAKLLDRVNKIIYDAVEGKISMTFFPMLLDFDRGEATFANAGHNFPVILTEDQSDDRLSKQAKSKVSKSYVIPLQLQGTPLGVDRNAEYKEKTVKFKGGDRIFFFTDGLIENHLPETSPMGRKTLLEILSSIEVRSCFHLKDHVLSEATRIFGNQDLADDVTIVVAEIDKRWQPGILPLDLNSHAPTLSLGVNEAV